MFTKRVAQADYKLAHLFCEEAYGTHRSLYPETSELKELPSEEVPLRLNGVEIWKGDA